jgi:hypothetical protein
MPDGDISSAVHPNPNRTSLVSRSPSNARQANEINVMRIRLCVFVSRVSLLQRNPRTDFALKEKSSFVTCKSHPRHELDQLIPQTKEILELINGGLSTRGE